MTTPTTRWTRLTRRLGADRNPLRRPADLIEAWLLPAVIVAFLALGPLAAGAASLWVHAGNAAARQAQRSWHRVPAVLLRAAPGPLMSDNGANTWLVETPARWTSGGRAHTGKIPAAAGSRADAVVPVWLDRAGNVRIPPPTADQVQERVIVVAAAALAALAVLLASLALLARWVLDRRRLAGWDAAWQAVGPQWSRNG
jgi:hypothetical protein